MQSKFCQAAQYKSKRVLMIDCAPLPRWFLTLFAPALTVVQAEGEMLEHLLATETASFDYVLVSESQIEVLSNALQKVDRFDPALPIILTSPTTIRCLTTEKKFKTLEHLAQAKLN